MAGNGQIQPVEVRVLIFKGRRKWVAQCLEFDVAVQADTREDLRAKFQAAIEAERRFCEERGLTPLTRLPRAPRRYFEIWDALQELSTRSGGIDQEPWNDMPPFIASAHTATAIEAA